MHETLNSLLSPTNWLVAMGNNWLPRVLTDASSMAISSPPPMMTKTPQNMHETSNSLFLPTN